MTATRTSRRSSRRTARRTSRTSTRTTTRRASARTTRKAAPARRSAKAKPAAKPLSKLAARLMPAPQVHFRLCRAGWAVIVDKIANAQGTRFVCPFCPLSHRVPGPVRGFRKFRRAQWVKLRRVEE